MMAGWQNLVYVGSMLVSASVASRCVMGQNCGHIVPHYGDATDADGQ